ncbi:MAG TPA: alpha/beta hydrolase [Solimonas sp.]|nr:alpha/beta hydrolase [Solimonas sp.]
MPTSTINGIALYHEVRGSGEPLLLIHGLGSSALDWEEQLDFFSRSYRVIAFDLRGHGRSDKPQGPYSIRQFSDDAAALLRQLDVSSAHVVGLSLGGAIAFQLALDHPGLARTLTIVNSGPELILRTLSERFAIGLRFVIVPLFGLPTMGRMISKRLFPDPASDGVRRKFEERFAGNQTRPYLDSLRALVGWSVTARLGEIRCPVLVVTADQDYTPVSLKEAYVAQLPDARLCVVPDSRHALPMERPAAFNQMLAGFLGEHVSAGQDS